MISTNNILIRPTASPSRAVAGNKKKKKKTPPNKKRKKKKKKKIVRCLYHITMEARRRRARHGFSRYHGEYRAGGAIEGVSSALPRSRALYNKPSDSYGNRGARVDIRPRPHLLS